MRRWCSLRSILHLSSKLPEVCYRDQAFRTRTRSHVGTLRLNWQTREGSISRPLTGFSKPTLSDTGVSFPDADSLFKRQPNETLIGYARASGAFTDGVVKLL